MEQRFSNRMSGLVSVALRAWTAITNAWQTVVSVDARPYRPEEHYMRGPGPKWRAAHAGPRDPAAR
jgi:hypothetical protein